MAIIESNPHRARITATFVVTTACLSFLITGCHKSAVNFREEGRLALNRGQATLALEKTNKAIEVDPSSARTQYQLGLVYLELNRDLEAQYALEKAYALSPHNLELTPKVLDALAEALFRQDRMSNLFDFLDKQVATTGTTQDFIRQGDYLAKAGDPDAARLAYRKAAYFGDTDDPEPYITIADFYISIGDQPNAVTSLRYANYVDPGNLDVAERLDRFGIVPGPTIAEAPPKPALLR
jgi:Flp pilus assembly protein TadD